jgi:hypothetical protein
VYSGWTKRRINSEINVYWLQEADTEAYV